jgi:hypothetical protein
MAADDKTGVVGNITKAIQDAWTFFVPPMFHLLLTAAVYVWLGGGPQITTAMGRLKVDLPYSHVQTFFNLLDQLKLTSLVPIVALVLLAGLAFAFDQLVMGVGALLPIGMAYSYSRLLASNPGIGAIWFRLPAITDLNEFKQAMDVQIAKARSEGQDNALENIDYWTRSREAQLRQFTFAKFLAVWTLCCRLVLIPHGSVHGLRAILALLVCVGWAWLSLVRSAYAASQIAYAEVTFVAANLTSVGVPELPADDPRRAEIKKLIDDQVGSSLWWWVGFSPFSWISVLKNWDHPWLRRRRQRKLLAMQRGAEDGGKARG